MDLSDFFGRDGVLFKYFCYLCRCRPQFETPVEGLWMGRQLLPRHLLPGNLHNGKRYRRAILTTWNFANFNESVKKGAAVDGLC